MALFTRMSRIHSTFIALVIAAAASAGLYATVHTIRLGQAATAPSVSPHEIAARRAKLVAWRRSLDATLAKRPPQLPKLPHFAPIPTPPPSVPPAQAPVTYVKAPTVVKYERAPTRTATTTRSSSDDGSSDDGAETGGDD